jgi:hypothetical protein
MVKVYGPPGNDQESVGPPDTEDGAMTVKAGGGVLSTVTGNAVCEELSARSTATASSV